MKNSEIKSPNSEKEQISINNSFLNCKRDRKGKYRATAEIFTELCQIIKKEKNSPKDVIDDINYLIIDYLENSNNESINF